MRPSSPVVSEDGTALSLLGVTKQYRSSDRVVPVLCDLHLTVGSTEVVVLMGKNGVGKSTVLNLAAGIDMADKGNIVRDTSRGPASLVVQDYRASLFPWLSCLENVYFPLTANSNGDRELRKPGIRAIRALGVKLPIRSYPYQLSGGQQQLTCLARSLATDPGYLLLDEPFASLDWANRRLVHGVLNRIWAKRQIATLMVCHDVEDALLLADRIVVLDGKPATVAETLMVPGMRPRSVSDLASPPMLQLRQTIEDRLLCDA